MIPHYLHKFDWTKEETIRYVQNDFFRFREQGLTKKEAQSRVLYEYETIMEYFPHLANMINQTLYELIKQ